MKIIYEFNEPEERNERKFFEISNDMYLALTDIQEYVRELRKGWKEDNLEKIIDTINEILMDSKISEIQ